MEKIKTRKKLLNKCNLLFTPRKDTAQILRPLNNLEMMPADMYP